MRSNGPAKGNGKGTRSAHTSHVTLHRGSVGSGVHWASYRIEDGSLRHAVIHPNKDPQGGYVIQIRNGAYVKLTTRLVGSFEEARREIERRAAQSY